MQPSKFQFFLTGHLATKAKILVAKPEKLVVKGKNATGQYLYHLEFNLPKPCQSHDKN